jgi:Transposase C of IS166 homeodomain
VPITPDSLPDDPAALRRIIAAMAQDALTAQAEIARLKFQLARYLRVEFGRSSEKLARDTEQLELALETLETDRAEQLATASPAVATAVETAAELGVRPSSVLESRRANLPREGYRARGSSIELRQQRASANPFPRELKSPRHPMR